MNLLIPSIPMLNVMNWLVCPPSKKYVTDALSLIAGGKAGGSGGILPEMVKICRVWYVSNTVNW